MEHPEGKQKQDEYIRALVVEVVRSLTDEDLSVSLLHAATFSTVEVRASPQGLSVLIGPKGQMARALRTLLAGSSVKLGRRYALDLVEVAESIGN